MTDPMTFNSAAERLEVISVWVKEGRERIASSLVLGPVSERDHKTLSEIVGQLDALDASVAALSEMRAERDASPDGGAMLDRHLAAADRKVVQLRGRP